MLDSRAGGKRDQGRGVVTCTQIGVNVWVEEGFYGGMGKWDLLCIYPSMVLPPCCVNVWNTLLVKNKIIPFFIVKSCP